jgi:hypothetical protein
LEWKMTPINAAFTRVMTPRAVPQVEVNAANELERRMRRIGASEAVRRFLGCYGKVRVRSTYALHLELYFRWLRGKGK